MAPRGGDTREDILKTASALLQERGFHAFSYGTIAEALGVKTAAVHYHFPTKTDLGLALIERYRARYRKWMDDAAQSDLSPWVQLEGYMSIAARFADDGRKACPAGILQAEFAAIPEEMQAATRLMVEEIHAWLVRLLDDGRAKGAFRFEGAPQDKATVLMATLQGALQAARCLGRTAFDAAVRQIRLELSP